MAIRAGEPWGVACDSAPDVTIEGDDAALLRAVTTNPGALIRFEPVPSSQIGRVLGLVSGSAPSGIAVPMDLLRLSDGRAAVNMVILGTPPDRQRWHTRVVDFGPPTGTATAVVVANGQFRNGVDLVPRGHPGDGRAEVHTYRLQRRERSAMRGRLASGTHVPHPRIETHSARTVSFQAPGSVSIEIDGRPCSQVAEITVSVVPNAYRLLL